MTAAEVFDFDKTLTYADTTLPLFCHDQPVFRRKRIRWCYYALAVLVKLRLLGVDTLKTYLLNGFFKSYSAVRWQAHCESFAKSIRTNKLYMQINWKEGQPWVVSASFEEVLRPLFPPNVQIIGSKAQRDSQGWHISSHAYSKNKAKLLRQAGVDNIFRVYTDSLADRYMMAMADEIVWVEGDKQTYYSRADWEFRFGPLPR
jgi:phosphoserine phosphatase